MLSLQNNNNIFSAYASQKAYQITTFIIDQGAIVKQDYAVFVE
jgi:hypothetical protein